MAQNTSITDFTQETLLPIYTASILQAPLANLPGATITSGVEITRINQLSGSLTFGNGKQTTARAVSGITSSNNLEPQLMEDYQTIDFDAFRQSAYGSYGSDASGAFLEGTTWLSDYVSQTSDMAALAGDSLLGARLRVQVSGTDAADAANRDVVRAGATAVTQANAIATVKGLIDDAPDAVKYNNQSQKVLLVTTGIDYHLRNAYEALDGRQIEVIRQDNSMSYNLPNTDVMVHVIPGIETAANDVTTMYFFETDNLYMKITTGMKAGFDDKDDEWWARFRFWFDINFADYTRVVTSVPATT